LVDVGSFGMVYKKVFKLAFGTTHKFQSRNQDMPISTSFQIDIASEHLDEDLVAHVMTILSNSLLVGPLIGAWKSGPILTLIF